MALGPESFAFSSGGFIFTSLNYGSVVLMASNGTIMHNVFFVGGFFLKTPEERNKLRKRCYEESLAGRLALNDTAMRICGRPLGIRLTENGLYVSDAYHGIFRISPNIYFIQGTQYTILINNPNFNM